MFSGTVYCITCLISNKKYIGSTTKEDINHRLVQHLNAYNSFLNHKTEYCTSFDVIKNRNVMIESLERVSYDEKEELKKRERYFIETMDCVNKNIPSRTLKEYYCDNIEYFKNYYAKHKNHERYKRTHVCECGVFYSLNNKNQHLNTLKHKKILYPFIYNESFTSSH